MGYLRKTSPLFGNKTPNDVRGLQAAKVRFLRLGVFIVTLIFMKLLDGLNYKLYAVLLGLHVELASDALGWRLRAN